MQGFPELVLPEISTVILFVGNYYRAPRKIENVQKESKIAESLWEASSS